MDLGLDRLRDEQILELQNTDVQLQQWEKFNEDYNKLQHRLEDLPNKVSYEIMVPLGSVALMPGRLVHTNKILVLLGENWFVEKSAKEACQVIDRRKKSIAKTIDGLKEQRKLIESRLEFTSDIQKETTGANGIVDIREEYDPEKEKSWRANRAKGKKIETRSGKETTKIRSGMVGRSTNGEPEQTSKTREQEEADLMARLDELERQEEEIDELARMDRDSDEEEEADVQVDILNDEPLNEETKKVKWKDQEERPVSRQLDETDGVPTIYFSHSELPSASPSSDGISSPADIYRLHQSRQTGIPNSTVQPKSILKESSQEAAGVSNPIQPVAKSPMQSIPESAFSGSIVEHKTDIQAGNQPKKRVSKFKQARQVKGQR